MKTLIVISVLGLRAISAATVPCAGIPDVTTLTGGNSCVVGDQTYSNFVVASQDTLVSVVIGMVSSEVIGKSDQIDFHIQTNPDEVMGHEGAWVTMEYEVTSSTDAMSGLILSNTDGVGVWIYDTACTGLIQGNNCYGDILGQTHAGPGVLGATATFTNEVMDMHEQKFIAFGDANIHNFSNAVTEAPEPITTALFGGGLLLVGLFKRKKGAK